jgi:hypothetical protein
MRTPAEYRERAAQLLEEAEGTTDTEFRDLCRTIADAFQQIAIRAEMQADGRTAILANDR